MRLAHVSLPDVSSQLPERSLPGSENVNPTKNRMQMQAPSLRNLPQMHSMLS